MAAKSDESKFFDVSKPHQKVADPTSKPVIVGHRPLIGDPMVKDDKQKNEVSEDDNKEPLDPIQEKAAKKVAIKDKGDEPAEEHSEMIAKHSSKADSLKPSDELVAQVSKDKETDASSATNNQLRSGLADEAPKKDQEKRTSEDDGAQNDEALKSGEVGEKVGNAGAVNAVLGEAEGVRKEEAEAEARRQTIEKLTNSGEYRVKLGSRQHHQGRGMGGPIALVIVLILIIFGLVYAAVGSGFIKSTDTSDPSYDTPKLTITTTNPTAKAVELVNYKLLQAGISFNYPKDWGTISLTAEVGYSKRDQNNPKSDGSFAYIANFDKNKNVEIVATSSKLLPASRESKYYDYLQWCVSTKDNKTYYQLLTHKTVNDVDITDAIICNQGPILNFSKLDNATILQKAVKDSDTLDSIGDIYTMNLTGQDYPVLRVKDLNSKNSDDIKKLLGSVKSL